MMANNNMTVSVEGTYGTPGTEGLLIAVSGHRVRLLGSSGGSVSIAVARWNAVKQLIDDAIAHYQILTAAEGETSDG